MFRANAFDSLFNDSFKVNKRIVFNQRRNVRPDKDKKKVIPEEIENGIYSINFKPWCWAKCVKNENGAKSENTFHEQCLCANQFFCIKM